MEAIVLAGGFGTRLSHIVSDVPKPMAPVAGKPFLVYILNDLIAKGVTRIVLAVGYKKECIIDFFADEYRGCQLIYSDEDTPLFTGGAIKKALYQCTENDVLVVNGDTYFDVPLQRMLDKHTTANADMTIASKVMSNFDRYATLQLNGEKIIGFEEKKPTENGFINGGIYLMKRTLLENVLDEKFSLETDFMEKKVFDNNFIMFESKGYFIDIGIEDDYRKAQEDFKMKSIKVGGRGDEYNIKKWSKEFSREELLQMYWNFHPRYRYVKCSAMNSSFLDIGAGEGGLAFWKEWSQPIRSDIKMYGVDLSIGKHVDMYENFTICNMDFDELPYKKEVFTEIFSSHVLEHIKNVDNYIGNINRTLCKDGRIYLEFPNHNSEALPNMQQYKDAGFVCSVTNFFDDATHLQAYSHDEVEKLLTDTGNFRIIESGTVTNKFLADLLLSYGYEKQDQEITTYGLWLLSKWSDYVVGEKL